MKRAPMNYGISRSHIYVSLESYICITEVPKGEERDRKTEKNILRDNGWNFPNLLKNLNA